MATRDNHTSSRSGRDRRCVKNNRNKHYYQYFIGLLAIICCSPVWAEGNTSVAANPVAAISGSVANQAVQINQGSLSTQSFATGHYCNGPVISITPYYLQTESFTSVYATNRNYGGQISLSMPLDGSSVELCKALARQRLEKGRLDYELVRIKECINIHQSGYQIHPASPFYAICADVLVADEPTSAEASPEL